MIGTMKAYILAGVSVAIFTAVTLYVVRAERAVSRYDAVVADLSEANDKIKGHDKKIAEKDKDITELRASRDTVNARLTAMIDDNNAAVEAEVARRRAAETDRNTAKEALRIALDTISTESVNDETFRTWLEQPAPDAAFDRLRNAAE